MSSENRILALPPASIDDLNKSLCEVIETRAFFGRDLCLQTTPLKGRSEEIKNDKMLSLITRAFFDLMERLPVENEASLSLFQERFATFGALSQDPVIGALTGRYQDLIALRIRDLKPAARTSAVPQVMNCILITDIDGSQGRHVDACVATAVQGASAGLPVVMPYQLLLNVISSVSFLDHRSSNRHYSKQALQLYEQLKAGTMAVFIDSETEIIVLTPPQKTEGFCLKSYKRLEFRTLLEEADRSLIVMRSQQTLSSEAIIRLLSSPIDKHLYWIGHGLIKRESSGRATQAMGLPLKVVARIINEIGSVRFCYLNSCYLKGNFAKLIKRVTREDCTIVGTAGIVQQARHFLDERADFGLFFYHAERVRETADSFALAGPYVTGLPVTNHPFWVSFPTKKIRPLTLTGFAAELEGQEAAPSEKRLFLTALYYPKTLTLQQEAALIPGFCERSNHILFEHVKTALSFEEFIKSGLITRDAEKDSATHLFLIRKLECKDGQFDKVLCFQKMEANSEVIYYEREGKWFSHKLPRRNQISPLMLYFGEVQSPSAQDRIKPLEVEKVECDLKVFLREARPSSFSFKQAGIEPREFYARSLEAFGFPLDDLESLVEEKKVSKGKGIKAEKMDESLTESFQTRLRLALISGNFSEAETFFNKVSLEGKLFDERGLSEILKDCITGCRLDAFQWILAKVRLHNLQLSKYIQEPLITLMIHLKASTFLEAFNTVFPLAPHGIFILSEGADEAIFEFYRKKVGISEEEIERLYHACLALGQWSFAAYLKDYTPKDEILKPKRISPPNPAPSTKSIAFRIGRSLASLLTLPFVLFGLVWSLPFTRKPFQAFWRWFVHPFTA